MPFPLPPTVGADGGSERSENKDIPSLDLTGMGQADVTLMCDNCKTYNPKESVYYDCAVNLQRFVETEFRRLGLI